MRASKVKERRVSHREDKLVAVPEADRFIFVIKVEPAQIKLSSSPPQVLVRLYEDRRSEFDGI